MKAEDLPPSGKKNAEDFMLGKNCDVYLPMTQNEPMFSVLTSPNSTEIAKLILNNNTSINSVLARICIFFPKKELLNSFRELFAKERSYP